MKTKRKKKLSRKGRNERLPFLIKIRTKRTTQKHFFKILSGQKIAAAAAAAAAAAIEVTSE